MKNHINSVDKILVELIKILKYNKNAIEINKEIIDKK